MSRFVPDPSFLVKVQTQPEFVGAFERLADQGAENLRAAMPVDTGAARGSVDGEVTREGGQTVARWGFGVDYWIYLEYGTSDTPTFAPLRRSLDATRM